MPVFISYSHNDQKFANELAMHLVRAKAHVWVDSWELNVGDSIITKIQEAIQEASALIIILSKESVESEWCRKEINAGLIRELEEKRIIMLPVLLGDCEIPLFLREKMYADFRTNFDEGLRKVLEAIAKVTSDTLGRIEQPEWMIDYAIDWGRENGDVWLRLTLVEQAEDKPYSVLSKVMMFLNEEATSFYNKYEKEGIDHIGRMIFFEMMRSSNEFTDLQIVLSDNFPQTIENDCYDSNNGAGLHIVITCRRLGEDNGKDIILNIGKQVSSIIEAIGRTIKPQTGE